MLSDVYKLFSAADTGTHAHTNFSFFSSIVID